MIPVEAVEAAAFALYERPHINSVGMADMRAALEAAAPHMLAEAWEEGMEAMYDNTSHEWPPIPEQNPYRSHRA